MFPRVFLSSLHVATWSVPTFCSNSRCSSPSLCFLDRLFLLHHCQSGNKQHLKAPDCSHSFPTLRAAPCFHVEKMYLPRSLQGDHLPNLWGGTEHIVKSHFWNLCMTKRGLIFVKEQQAQTTFKIKHFQNARFDERQGPASLWTKATLEAKTSSSPSTISSLGITLYVWNIPEDNLGQLSWLCPLPYSCPYLALLLETRGTVTSWYYVRTAQQWPKCSHYEYCFSHKSKTRHPRESYAQGKLHHSQSQ